MQQFERSNAKSIPLLAQFGITPQITVKLPCPAYDTVTETNFEGTGAESSQIWATSSLATYARGDPTNDEPMDR